MLEQALPAGHAAIGLTVPTAQACDSIRWARRVLELVDSGVIDDAPLIRCEDHLITLWLLSDPALLDQLAQRELAAVAGISNTRRERLIETLRIWLDTRGTAAQMGELLDVHPQTVRYRMRSLETIFGDQLVDPESRFATEAVLRALRLRARSAGTAPRVFRLDHVWRDRSTYPRVRRNRRSVPNGCDTETYPTRNPEPRPVHKEGSAAHPAAAPTYRLLAHHPRGNTV